MGKTLRTLILIIPVCLLVCNACLQITSTAIRSAIYWAFKKPNYWDLSNEWFQIKTEIETWYDIWQNGSGWNK